MIFVKLEKNITCTLKIYILYGYSDKNIHHTYFEITNVTYLLNSPTPFS